MEFFCGFFFICGLFCDKRLISCFSRCGIFTNIPHSKNTQSSRFSSKYPRKLVEVFPGDFANYKLYNGASAVCSGDRFFYG